MGYQIETKKKLSQKSNSDGSRLSDLLQKEIHLFGSGLTNAEKEHFYGEVSLLINAGVPLKTAIESFTQQVTKKKSKHHFDQLLSHLNTGSSLQVAANQVGAFTSFEEQSLGIGEQAGRLSEILEELHRFFANRVKNRRLLISALTYPIIIACTAILVLLFMLSYVVPMFADIFAQDKVDLPAITAFIVKLSGLLGEWGGWLLLAIIILFLTGRWFLQLPRVKGVIQEALLRFPLLGDYLRIGVLARFSNTIRLTTLSGIPLVRGLEMVNNTIAFLPFNSAMESVINGIIAGNSLSSEAGKAGFFDTRMISMLKVGESTSENSKVFANLADYYNKKLEQQSKLFTTLLEPFIILVVGVFVGVVLISMYLPMFQLGQVLG